MTSTVTLSSLKEIKFPTILRAHREDYDFIKKKKQCGKQNNYSFMLKAGCICSMSGACFKNFILLFLLWGCLPVLVELSTKEALPQIEWTMLGDFLQHERMHSRTNYINQFYLNLLWLISRSVWCLVIIIIIIIIIITTYLARYANPL